MECASRSAAATLFGTFFPTTAVKPHDRKASVPRVLIGTAVLTCVIAVFWLFRSGPDDTHPVSGRPAAGSKGVNANPDPREPEPSLATLLHVAETGGNRLEREAASAWLDTLARERDPLDHAAEARVFEILRGDGHPAWSGGYRLHLFNSAFNALHHSRSAGELAALLHHLAVRDPDPAMRLYALQHIRTLRSAGSLSGSLAGEIRATLETMAGDAGGALSGLAVAILVDWDENQSDPAELRRALAIASDRSRPADVRVAALHAAGESVMALARGVSRDTAEPLILRKAAVSRLGNHGGADDLEILETLRGESGRLDQAVRPAIDTLRSRLSDPTAPKPQPYRTIPLR